MEIILVRIFLYSVQIQENKDQKKFCIWILFMQCLFRLPFPNRENTKNTVFVKNANVYEKLRGQYNFLKRFQNYIRCLQLCQVSSVWHLPIRIKQDVGNFILLPNVYHWMECVPLDGQFARCSLYCLCCYPRELFGGSWTKTLSKSRVSNRDFFYLISLNLF